MGFAETVLAHGNAVWKRKDDRAGGKWQGVNGRGWPYGHSWYEAAALLCPVTKGKSHG